MANNTDVGYLTPIRNISIYNFRNIDNLVFTPGKRINIIYGDNAKGKTNLVEAIWLFTGEKSFRNVKESQLIKLGQNESCLTLNFFAGQRQQTATIKFTPQKSIFLNHCQVKTIFDFIGSFSAIIFSPEDLTLAKGGPNKRRSFLDVAISQIKPSYAKLLLEYNKILSQRNALLKDLYRYPSLISTLDVWDEVFAKISAKITLFRFNYLKALTPIMQEIYDEISGEKEHLELEYVSRETTENFSSFEVAKKYFTEKILNSRGADIKAGFSLIGPHRDDFSIMIDQLNVKNFASQGQQRSVVLALKLAEAQVLNKLANKNPVILLDDVLSELDVNRQQHILKFLEGMQCFITCCDKNYFNNISSETSLFKIDELIKFKS